MNHTHTLNIKVDFNVYPLCFGHTKDKNYVEYLEEFVTDPLARFICPTDDETSHLIEILLSSISIKDEEAWKDYESFIWESSQFSYRNGFEKTYDSFDVNTGICRFKFLRSRSKDQLIFTYSIDQIYYAEGYKPMGRCYLHIVRDLSNTPIYQCWIPKIIHIGTNDFKSYADAIQYCKSTILKI